LLIKKKFELALVRSC